MAEETKKLTVGDVLKAHLAITELVQSDKRNKYVFPSAVRMKLAGNLRKTKGPYEEYEKEKFDLIKELGEALKDNPDQIKVKPENEEKFNAEVKEMIESESDVVLNPITYKDIGENQIEIDTLAFLEDVGLLKA